MAIPGIGGHADKMYKRADAAKQEQTSWIRLKVHLAHNSVSHNGPPAATGKRILLFGDARKRDKDDYWTWEMYAFDFY